MRLAWPVKLLFAFCFLLPLTYWPPHFDQFATSKMAIFLMAIFILLLFVIYYRRDLSQLPRPLAGAALIFMAVQIWQTLRLADPLNGLFGAYGQSESLLVQLGFLIFGLAAFLMIKADSERHVFLDTMIFASFILAIFGVFQYFYDDPITREEVARIKSLLGDPNSLGVFLMMVLPLLLWRLHREPSQTIRSLLFGCAYLNMAVLALTFSRAAWLGLLISLIFCWFHLNRSNFHKKSFWLNWGMIGGSGAVLLISMAYLPFWVTVPLLLLFFWVCLRCRLLSDPESLFPGFVVILILGLISGQMLASCKPGSFKDYNLNSRIQSLSTGQDSGRGLIWSTAWRVFLEHPVFGQGLGSFQDSFHRIQSVTAVNHWGPDRDLRQVHNEPLHYLATQGIIGLGSYLLLLGLIVKYSLRNFKSAAPDIAIITLSASAIGYLVFVQFAYPLVHYSYLFWVEAGILLSLALPSSRQNRPFGRIQPVAIGLALIFLSVWGGLLLNFARSDTYYQKAFNQARYRHYARSLAAYRTTVAMAPWNYQYRYRYAYTLIRAGARCRNEILAQRNYEQAEQLVNELRQHFPARYQVYSLTGDLYFQQQQYGRAIRAYQKALTYFPVNYRIYFRIARSEVLNGNRAAGVKTFKQGCKINREAMEEMRGADRLKIFY